jgi:hypothetical protein
MVNTSLDSGGSPRKCNSLGRTRKSIGCSRSLRLFVWSPWLIKAVCNMRSMIVARKNEKTEYTESQIRLTAMSAPGCTQTRHSQGVQRCNASVSRPSAKAEIECKFKEELLLPQEPSTPNGRIARDSARCRGPGRPRLRGSSSMEVLRVPVCFALSVLVGAIG